MWAERCEHCNTRQLFGYRRLVKVENESRGVIWLQWSCPGCKGLNRLRTGAAA